MIIRLLNSKSTVKITKVNAKQWPGLYQANFLTPGVCSYEDVKQGKALLKKEAIDKFVQNFIGKPVVIKHQNVDTGNYEDLAVGYITEVWFNEKDAWYYCKFLITKDEGRKEIEEEGCSVSCAYDVLDTKGGGEYLAVKYDEEILDGMPNHLALVDTPRYEDARITKLNSKAGKLKLSSINQKGGSMDLVIKIGEKLVPLATISQKLNTKVVPMELAGDQELDLEGGQKMKVSDMITKYNEAVEKEKEVELCNECGEKKHEGPCDEEKKTAFQAKKKNEEESAEEKKKEEEAAAAKKKNEEEAKEKELQIKKENELKARAKTCGLEETATEEEIVKKENEMKAEEEAIKKENEKRGVDHFVKLNSLKNDAGHFDASGMVDTLGDKVARGKDRYSLKR
jgi:flagellar biosynthesis GTPase FlhF